MLAEGKLLCSTTNRSETSNSDHSGGVRTAQNPENEHQTIFDGETVFSDPRRNQCMALCKPNRLRVSISQEGWGREVGRG